MRIRQGNDFIFLWAIERNGEPEDFSNAVNIRLHFKNYDCVGEVKSFQIVDGNIVRVEVSPEWASNLGAYRLILSYEFENQSYSDGDQKCVVDVLAFNIVPKTSEADDITEMAKTTDIMIGLRGLSAYEVWLKDNPDKTKEDYYNWLRQPATDAVSLIDDKIEHLDEVIETSTENEAGRVSAENIRTSNEAGRVNAESQRVDNEVERLANEASRASNELIREENESLRKQDEATRKANENEREIAETTRISNENNRVTAEQERADAESLRATAESSRELAEGLRVEAELLRQTNTQEAISNAENAAENANTAAQNADDAREAIQDDLALKEATANKQNSLAPDGTGTKFPTVDAVNAGINTLLASYKLTSNTEIHMTALDPVTGIFTANNHGLTQDKVIAWNLNTGVNLLPYQVIPVEITDGQYGNYYVDIVDANNFRIKKTPTDQTLTFASAGDITKWHFETNLANNITISNLAPYKKMRVVTKIISNSNTWFSLFPTNVGATGNNWYINGEITNLYQATLNSWGRNMPAYVESEFYFDEISTVHHRIYGYRHLPASPTTAEPANLDLVWMNMENLGALTINNMSLSSRSRYLLNGTTIEIYKI